MRYYIPFIDKLVSDADQYPHKGIKNAWVFAEPIEYSDFEGLKQRLYWAIQVFRGNAYPYKYVRTEIDLAELKSQMK